MAYTLCQKYADSTWGCFVLINDYRVRINDEGLVVPADKDLAAATWVHDGEGFCVSARHSSTTPSSPNHYRGKSLIRNTHPPRTTIGP